MRWPPPAAAAAALLVLLLRLLLRRAFRARRVDAALRGAHVWVTGGSQGLGLALAARSLAAGARGVTLSARDAGRLAAAAASLRGGERVALAPADVAAGGGDAVRRAHAEAVARFGPVDVAVANAGVNHGGRVFEDVGWEEAERVVATNLGGVVRVFMAALPGMRARGKGVLCAVGSLAGYRGVPGASVYGASKAGVSALCESLNVELVATGVTVVCACPGFVDTPAIAGLTHAKPLMLSAEAAAEQVLDAVARRQRHVGFPVLMELVVMPFARALPSPLYEWVLHLAGAHQASSSVSVGAGAASADGKKVT